MSDTEIFSEFCIVELLGHRRLGAKVTEVQLAGAGFLRLDVYENGDEPILTQLVSPASVYAITPTTEEVARALARQTHAAPVTRYELDPPKSPAYGGSRFNADLDDFEDEERETE